MHPFSFIQSDDVEGALKGVDANAEAVFFAGGTTLLDLMKLDVMTPAELVDISSLPFSSIDSGTDGMTIGANARNSDLAHDRTVRERFPVLSEALLSGASAQLRNMATTAGNLLQRTRCNYFRDVHAKCNKRQPGSGCDAISGFNRGHAVLGTSDHCIATHPSDMCVALMILDAVIETRQRNGKSERFRLANFICCRERRRSKKTCGARRADHSRSRAVYEAGAAVALS